MTAESDRRRQLLALVPEERFEELEQMREQHDELNRLAKPLYIKQLASSSYFAARIDNDQFWAAYIGSRVVAARRMVATSLGKPFQGESPL